MTDHSISPTAIPTGPTTSESSAPQDGPRLRGRMGVFELVFTVLAFTAPLAAAAGYIPFVIIFNPAAPVAFVLAMLILLCFVVGYMKMAMRLPNPGAFYAYITAGLGRLPGLGAAFLAVYGYLLLEVGVYCFFGISTNAFVAGHLGGPDIAWYWYTLAIWLAVGACGYFQIELSAKILTVAMICEVLIVAVFDAVVLVDGGPQGRTLEPFSLGTFTSGSVGLGLMFAFVMFLGFEATAIFREEVKDPERTVPRATYLAVVSITVFYVITSWLMLVAYGMDEGVAIATENPAGMFLGALETYVGTVAVDIASVLLITSLFAALLSAQNVLSRYTYSLGVDGAFPRALGRAHPRHHSPYLASLTVSAVTAVILVIAVASSFDPGLLYGRLAGMGTAAIVILMFLTSVAVIAFFRQRAHISEASAWQRLVAPGIASVGLGAVLYLAMANFNLLLGSSTLQATLLGLLTWGVLAAGVAVAAYLRKRKPEIYQRIGRQ